MALSPLEQLKAKALAMKQGTAQQASSTTPVTSTSAPSYRPDTAIVDDLIPATPIQLDTPPSNTTPTPVVSNRRPLPAMGGLSKLQPRTPAPAIAETRAAIAVESVAQVQQQVTMAMTTVPDGILQLNPAIQNIEGLNATAFQATLASTYKALVEDQPDLPKMLELINRNLRQYEELCYLLSPEQLGLYFDGLMKVTATKINTTKPKAEKASKAAAAPIAASDLIL